MNMFIFLYFIFVLLFVYAIYRIKKNDKKEALRLELDGKEANRLWEEKLTTDIAEWLALLDLPAFKKEEKRLNAARKLSVILIQRLLLQ